MTATPKIATDDEVMALSANASALRQIARVSQILRTHHEQQLRQLKRDLISPTDLAAVLAAHSALDRLAKGHRVQISELELVTKGLKAYLDSVLPPARDGGAGTGG